MRTMIAALAAVLVAGTLAAADTGPKSLDRQGGTAAGGPNEGQLIQPGSDASGDRPEEQSQTITTSIAAVHAPQKTVTVYGDNGNKFTCVLSDRAVIIGANGETMKADALKPGMMATITYTGTIENATVSRIAVRNGK